MCMVVDSREAATSYSRKVGICPDYYLMCFGSLRTVFTASRPNRAGFMGISQDRDTYLHESFLETRLANSTVYRKMSLLPLELELVCVHPRRRWNVSSEPSVGCRGVISTGWPRPRNGSAISRKSKAICGKCALPNIPDYRHEVALRILHHNRKRPEINVRLQ